MANYEAIEQRFTRIVMKIVRGVSLLAGSIFMLSCLFPVSYAFFNYPQPEQWKLPIAYT